MSMRS